MKETHQIKNKIIGKRVESPNVVTLEFACEPRVPEYCAGQFIDIYFPELGTAQGKSYSISSAPSENTFCITIKGIGEFSNKLCSLKEGDLVISSLPYGFFYSDLEDTHLIMIGGGIGVTPFRSTIAEYLSKYPYRKISLFYSNRSVEDITFKNELDRWQSSHSKFKAKYFITRQETIPKNCISGRITAERILSEIPSGDKAEFLICGSIAFVRDMRKSLIRSGVQEEVIYTEAFFSH